MAGRQDDPGYNPAIVWRHKRPGSCGLISRHKDLYAPTENNANYPYAKPAGATQTPVRQDVAEFAELYNLKQEISEASRLWLQLINSIHHSLKANTASCLLVALMRSMKELDVLQVAPLPCA